MAEKLFRPNALGLSCVENYTLSILEKHFSDLSCLFCISYLRGHYLLSKIIEDGLSLKNFSLLTRVHEVAFENLSLLYLSSYDEVEITGIWGRMKVEKDNTYYLIKVNPSFVSKSFNVALERDDHYICYWFNDGKNNVFNDYPYRLAQFSEYEISTAYNENIIVFEIIKEVDETTKSKAKQLFYNHVSQLDSQTNIENFEKITLEQIKEFLVIYKRILHRTLLYCSSLAADASLMSQNLHAVDNLLTKIKVNELRRKEIVFTEDITDILHKDQMIYKTVQQAAKECELLYA